MTRFSGFQPFPVIRIIGDNALVFFCHQRGRDQEVSRRAVTGYRGIPDYSDPQKGFYICVVWLWFEWVPEKDHKVYVTLCNL
jgi:hypothetical protein